ncbi:hypothetical protein HDU67_005434 [Dinochytrium kinnereticum]|nr:hypothetical protein HDU67_005434 [Dinochytrium kinnereticum]
MGTSLILNGRAAFEVWKDLKEVVTVEKAERLLAAHSILLQMLPGSPIFRPRRLLSYAAEKEKHDLVICSNSLRYVPQRDHEEAIKSLWRLTSDVLVFIENGDRPSFDLICKARDQILASEDVGHVVAPVGICISEY